jgi:hypothetical protein
VLRVRQLAVRIAHAYIDTTTSKEPVQSLHA